MKTKASRLFLLTTFLFVHHHMMAQMSGTYTINSASSTSGTNFNSFADACSTLSASGINGNVTINVVSNSGPYFEQVKFDSIPGSNDSSGVTVNGNNNVVNALPTSSAYYLLQLNNVEYLTIKNLTFRDSSDTYGWGCHMINDARYNTIDNCVFDLSKTNSTNVHYTAGIVASNNNTETLKVGPTGSYNTFTNNIIDGGDSSGMYTGVSLVGDILRKYGKGNRIINNEIKNFYYQGFRVQYADSTFIQDNDISRPDKINVYTSTIGIRLVSTRAADISKNRIHDLYGPNSGNVGTAYAIYCSSSGFTGNDLLIYNNLIYHLNTTGSVYGLFFSSSRGRLYHNSISFDEDSISSTGFASGIYMGGSVYNTSIVNNNISITRNGPGDKRGIIIPGTSNDIFSDGNNIFLDTNSSPGYFGRYGGLLFYTLSSWQGANDNSFDQNSNDVNPMFTNPDSGNLIPTSYQVNDIGIEQNIFSEDYNSNTRNTDFPDPGAFEFTPSGLDLHLTEITEPFLPCPGTNDVKVHIRNAAATQIDSFRVNWSINGVVQSAFHWTNSLSYNEDTTITIGSMSFDSSSSYAIKAWVSHPNGISDNNSANDTNLIQSIASSMSGTYTVGSSGDYQTLFDLVLDLNKRGLCASVVVNVDSASGPYDSSLVIGPVLGASSSNTLTFNGNGSVIQDSTNNFHEAVVHFMGAPYTTWDNFVVKTLSTDRGYGLALGHNMDHTSITNCYIDISSTSTNTPSAGIITRYHPDGIEDFTTNHCVISNNTIDGGNGGGMRYGIFLSGDYPNYNKGNRIINNTVVNAYSYHIYAPENDSIEIAYNDISRPSKSSYGTFYGIYLIDTKRADVHHNRIHHAHSSPSNFGTVYGIYQFESDSNDVSLFYNNLIYKLGGRSARTGIRNVNCHGSRYYFNTISFDDVNALGGFANGISIGNVDGAVIKNNLINCTSGGSTNSYALYIDQNATQLISDNNLLHVNGVGSINAAVRFENQYLSMKEWQAQNSSAYDQNSDSLSPIFDSIANDDYTPTSFLVNNIGTPINGITLDFDSVVRDVNNPDVGAFEFTPEIANDSCSEAIMLTNDTVLISSTASSTPDFAPTCVTKDDSSGGVWYKYEAQGGFISVSLCGSTFDTRIRAYSGDCSNLICVAGNNDSCSTQSSIGICSDSAVTYYFLVHGSEGEEGVFTLELHETPSQSVSLTINGNTSFCDGDSVELVSSIGSSYLWNDSSKSTTQNLIVFESGDYYVRTADTNGCLTASDSVQVTKFILDTVSVSYIGTTTFCSGDSLILNAIGSSNYVWNDSAQSTSTSLIVYESGQYFVTATDSNGCADTSNSINVTKISSSVLSVLASGPLSFCEGDSVTLTASGASNYLWNDTAASTTPSITIYESGNYYVSTLDTNGCSDTSNVYAVVKNIIDTASISASGPTSFCEGDSVILTANLATDYLWNNSQQSTTRSITVKSSGSFMVTTIDFNNCADSSLRVNTNEFQVKEAKINALGPLSICDGDSVVLQSNINLQYEWKKSGNIIGTNREYVARTQGTYTVTTTDSNSCSTDDSVFVKVSPIPQVFLGNDTTICKDNVVTLDAGFGHTSVQWSTGETTQSIFFFGTVPGTYSISVLVTDSTGCSASDKINIVVDDCLGIEENTFSNVLLFPNPSSGDINLLNLPIDESLIIEIADLQGKRIAYFDNIRTREFKFELDSSPGQYVLRLIGGSDTKVFKIILE